MTELIVNKLGEMEVHLLIFQVYQAQQQRHSCTYSLQIKLLSRQMILSSVLSSPGENKMNLISNNCVGSFCIKNFMSSEKNVSLDR